MKEELEKKSVALQIVEFKYTIPIVIAVFLIIMTWVMILYFRAGDKKRSTIMTALSLFGSTMLVFNLMLIIYRELRESVHIKRAMVTAMDEQVVTEIRYIFREMLHNKQYLGQIHDEIMEGRVHAMGTNGRPELTYHESNFLFIVFQVMQNFYRNYEFNTSDEDTRNNYNSWRQFLLRLMSSPKVQQFYAMNKHLINDLLFNKFLSLYVLPYVDQYVPETDLIPETHMNEYRKRRDKWEKEKAEKEITDVRKLASYNPDAVIQPLNLSDL